MEKFYLLKDILIIMAFALPILFIFNKLKLSSLVGFLFTGILIGPFGLGLIHETEQIEVMAEIGVILLMFTIGLEFSIEKIIQMKSLLFKAGGIQFVVTTTIAALIFSMLEFSVQQSIFFGMLIALSSTAIIMKTLMDRNELSAPHAKISISISVFQDLAIVPMIILIPVLGAGENISLINIISTLFFSFGVMVLIIITAKFLMPKIIFQLANTRQREVFTIGIILLILGTAYSTYTVGLSLSIGAFIAGIIISESDYNHQIVAEILPFKDAFNSLFFVSIGMLLNATFLLEYPIQTIILITGIIVGKGLIVGIMVLFMKFPIRTAIISGIIISQIGEFSFVLAQSGLQYNLIADNNYNGFIAASIFTMFISPILIYLSPVIADKLKFFDLSSSKGTDEFKTLKNHVIIVGFGLNGKNLATVLKETGIPYTIIELNPETVKKQKLSGENILFGDCTKVEILKAAGAEYAKIIVYAISDPRATLMSLKAVKDLNKSIHSIVRTRYTSEIESLHKNGADEVIPEEFETSLQIFSRVLTKFHIPLNIIMKQMQILRQSSYSFMREPNHSVTSLTHIDEILAAGLTETFYVDEHNPFVNKNLREINLRALTDATIIAIVREEKNITNPPPDTIILPKDTLVITGTHRAVDSAIEYLSGNEEEN